MVPALTRMASSAWCLINSPGWTWEHSVEWASSSGVFATLEFSDSLKSCIRRTSTITLRTQETVNSCNLSSPWWQERILQTLHGHQLLLSLAASTSNRELAQFALSNYLDSLCCPHTWQQALWDQRHVFLNLTSVVWCPWDGTALTLIREAWSALTSWPERASTSFFSRTVSSSQAPHSLPLMLRTMGPRVLLCQPPLQSVLLPCSEKAGWYTLLIQLYLTKNAWNINQISINLILINK